MWKCKIWVSYNFFFSESEIVSGTPVLKDSKSLLVADKRIFDADIPSNPSPSGSLSPAEQTSKLSKSYNFPL